MSLIVLPFVSFPGFMDHCKLFCMQLFLVVFCEVPALPDNPIQPPCPLAISLVVNWVEDIVTLGVFELCRLCRDKFPRELT